MSDLLINEPKIQETVLIPIEKLVFNPLNCNLMDSEMLEKLEAEVHSNNYDAIMVSHVNKDGKYMVFDGEHRVKCAIKLGHSHMRAIIHDIGYSEALPYYYKRQTIHGNTDPFKQCALFNYMKEKGLNSEEIGTKFGVSAQLVRARQALNSVCDDLKRQYYDGKLSISHIEELCSMGQEDQEAFGNEIISKNIPVSEIGFEKKKWAKPKTLLYPFVMRITVKSKFDLNKVPFIKLEALLKSFFQEHNHEVILSHSNVGEK